MNAEYEILPNLQNRILRVNLSGLWDDASVDSFDTAMVAAQRSFKAATSARGGYSVLVDITKLMVQTKTTSEKWRLNIQKYSRESRNWVVLIERIGLNSSQAKRMVPNAHFHTSEAEAIDWNHGRSSRSG